MKNKSNHLGALLLEGQFGLEKENNRTDITGHLALTPHPKTLGIKDYHPYITTDFSESQIEMITPPMKTLQEAIDFMATLHDIVTENIGTELLWPQSLPPVLPSESEIPIAQFSSENSAQEQYRRHIAEIYGTYRQLITGIHFNISFNSELLSKLCTQNNLTSNDLYLRTTRNFMRYRWLLVWLYGASPIADKGFRVTSLKDQSSTPMFCKNSISLRTGPKGYRNRDTYTLDYTSFDAFKKSVNSLVSQNILSDARELYLPIRLKTDTKDVTKIDYLEIRLLDLDPTQPNGISTEVLHFTHLFIIFCLLKEELSSFDNQEQQLAAKYHDTVSCLGRDAKTFFNNDESIADKAALLIAEIESILCTHDLTIDGNYAASLKSAKHYTLYPDQRVGVKIYNKIINEGFIPYNLRKAKEYKAISIQQSYRFHGLEQMEMSTQLLLKAALLKGAYFELIDKDDNFIRLYNQNKEEYVCQATKTSLDNYVSILKMENKSVTKKILEKHNIRTPHGENYLSSEQAKKSFSLYKDSAIVIKPKSTNFGIGITILKENNNPINFNKAIDIAFQADNNILIEEFITGKEYRFFVINDQVVAILHRVPANVEGDGIHTISELVDIKNTDPLRGTGYHTPLEKLKKGEAEIMFLESQSMTLSTIPQLGEKIYLRENSNISTGGDSIDFTDDIDQSYKQIAVNAAKALDVKITGVDMMINNITQPASQSNHAIIEMNFNPAIHIHCFPYQGKRRAINMAILEALGF